jgi:hypothetical protein
MRYTLSSLIIVSVFTLNSMIGTIYSSENRKETLAGVRIISSIDTTYSDMDGKFSIKSNENDVIKFNLISYNQVDTTFVKNK